MDGKGGFCGTRIMTEEQKKRGQKPRMHPSKVVKSLKGTE